MTKRFRNILRLSDTPFKKVKIIMFLCWKNPKIRILSKTTCPGLYFLTYLLTYLRQRMSLVPTGEQCYIVAVSNNGRQSAADLPTTRSMLPHRQSIVRRMGDSPGS